MPRTTRVPSVIAIGASLLLAACGSGPGHSDVMADGGWPGTNGDARNSASTSVTGARTLGPVWSRSLGGPAAAGASIAQNGQVFVSASTPGGCNLFGYQMDTGRQRFCDHIPLTDPTPSRIIGTPVVDSAVNAYIGDPGFMRAYNQHGQERWWAQVLGTPTSAQFTGSGDVLAVTHMAEVSVFDRQNGKRLLPALRLLGEPDRLTQPDLPWPPNDQGLDDCATGKPGCPVATSPAMDVRSDRFFLTLWQPGHQAASLLALRYADGKIVRLWSQDILTGGSIVNPVLSADAGTVYAGDNAGDLIAVDAATGKTRWTHPLGFTPSGCALTPDGVLLPGGDGGKLLALRDRGDHVDPLWERHDLAQLGVPVVAAGGTGYALTRTDADRTPTLLAFDTADGGTLGQNAVSAAGPTAGLAIGPDGEVVLTTRAGGLFVFKPQ